ncbi:MAG TPA: DUF5069 domain-containing protein [Candidatus Limnocylindrales bacterium]|nr:DUF5069 domain-containing protein [Candidatus Limnocylindrales bacterium]
MEPLDLESRPPRGPREQLLGFCFLPRTIDKIRAELPGGKIGGYLVAESTMSSYLLHKMGVKLDELRAVVARAADENEVVEWLRERVDPAVAEQVNAKLASSSIADAPPEKQQIIRDRHPVLAERPDVVNAFEMLELDDARTVSSRSARS